MYLSTGLGGVIGCTAGGLLTLHCHPRWCWFWYSWMGLFTSIFALFLTKESEMNEVFSLEDISDHENACALQENNNERRIKL
jgi:hypothetical protein